MEKQQMRISDEEISIFKNTFAENDILLKSVRKAMLGLPMKADEAAYLGDLFTQNEALQKAVRRIFLPEIEGDVPFGQNLDLYMTFQMEGKTPHEVYLAAEARKRLIALLEKGLVNLCLPLESNVSQYQPDSDVEENYITLVARNTLITHTDQQLLQIKILAGQKDETVEETKKRLAKNSNK